MLARGEGRRVRRAAETWCGDASRDESKAIHVAKGGTPAHVLARLVDPKVGEIAQRRWCSASGSELKLLVAQAPGRKPDVVVPLPGTPAPPRRGPLTEPPDIVVEVVSPSPKDERRDRVEKMSEYARFGVRY